MGFCGGPFESIVEKILKGNNMYIYTKSWKTEACSARLQGERVSIEYKRVLKTIRKIVLFLIYMLWIGSLF